MSEGKRLSELRRCANERRDSRRKDLFNAFAAGIDNVIDGAIDDRSSDEAVRQAFNDWLSLDASYPD